MKCKSGKRWAFVILHPNTSMLIGDPQSLEEHYTKKTAMKYRADLRKNGFKCGKIFLIPSEELT
jgi:hypothetical protein